MNKLISNKEYGKKMFDNAESSNEQQFGSFYLSRLLGFNVSYRDNLCIVDFEAIPTMFNPQGFLHGGIITTAMDISMGHLLHHTTGSASTLEMNVKFLLPIIAEHVACKGSFLRQGRSISFLQSHMYKQNGKLAAYASATWKPLKDN